MFKTGQKVIVKKYVERMRSEEPGFMHEMETMCGKVVTLGHGNNGVWGIEEFGYAWNEKWFVKIKKFPFIERFKNDMRNMQV